MKKYIIHIVYVAIIAAICVVWDITHKMQDTAIENYKSAWFQLWIEK